MKVLLTGSSGVLGQSLTPFLQDKGIEVIGVDTNAQAPNRYDIRDTSAISELAKGCDLVVHAAAALPSYASHEIWSVDVDGTRSVLRAAQNAGVLKFLHVSSTAVYGLPKLLPTPEDYPRLGVDAYSRAKGQAERECELVQDRFSQLTIVRPKTFLGPGRLGLFSMLFEWASEGRNFPVLGDGTQRTQMLDTEDLCQVLFKIIHDGTPGGLRAYNIGAASFGGIGEDFQAVLDEAGYGGRIRHLPLAPAAYILQAAAAIGRSPVYPRLISKLKSDSFVDISRAETELEFRPRYSNQDSLVRTYRWWLATRQHQQPASGTTHTAPWRQGILRLAKPIFG